MISSLMSSNSTSEHPHVSPLHGYLFCNASVDTYKAKGGGRYWI